LYLLVVIKVNPLSIQCIDWFQAGKGPDPVKLKLDQDMDEYFKGKATTAAGTV